MKLTVDKLKNTDLELIEMLFEAFNTEDKIVDVISRFAAKYHKTESSVRARWNSIRPFYIEMARERGLTDIVEEAERKSRIANKNAQTRQNNKLISSKPVVAKKTNIKKQELFDRFSKTDYMLEKLEQMQKETLQHIQISHKSNDARFNGISGVLNLIVENAEKTKQIDYQASGLITVDKFGQVQAIGMNESIHLDEDKVIGLIDGIEKLELELKNEKQLHINSMDSYDVLKRELVKMHEKLDNAECLIREKDQIIEEHMIIKVQLEKEITSLTGIKAKLMDKNEELHNVNKLLNKRGLIGRLLNKDVEYNTVTN